MTKNAARHRAPLSLRARASRAWLAVSALPVGALAGCAALSLAATQDAPRLGLLGLGAALVPVSVSAWRTHLSAADPSHGRRAAGRPVVATTGVELTGHDLVLATAPTAAAVPAVMPLPITLDGSDLASLRRATRADGSRLFSVAAGSSVVDVVVLTREERAELDLAELHQIHAVTPAGSVDERELLTDRVAA